MLGFASPRIARGIVRSRAFVRACAATPLMLLLCQAAAPVLAEQLSCASLASLHLPNTTITAAEEVTGGSFDPPPAGPGGGGPIANLPPFCRVAASIPSAINFEVWLPLANWNGRFQGVGNGGTAGTIGYSAMAAALRGNFATASTDTGHAATDTTWFTNPQQLVDHGYRSIHEMTVQGKALTRAFYGRHAKYSYFSGCSTGGGQGFMETQRFADDYDGILAGAPSWRRTRLYATHVNSWRVTHDDPAANLPAATLALIGNAVVAKCDALDGVADGVIENPMVCRWQPVELLCKSGQDPATCLNAAQVRAVEKLYQGPKNPRTGEQIFPGYMRGAEFSWGTVVGGGTVYSAGANPIRFAVKEDPNYDFNTFDFDADVDLLDSKLGVWNAENSDIRTFKKRGGKVIVYHGWADWAITPRNTLDYYHRLVSVFKERHQSRRDAESEVAEFWRMFFIPGMGHCSGGPGTDQFDGITPLVDWVEKGKAPKRIEASHLTNGVVDETRPLCAYPKQAVYTGQGDPNIAANFACRALRGGQDRDEPRPR